MILTIERCAKHGMYAVGAESDDGSGQGRRLTSMKCCGQWSTLARFRTKVCTDHPGMSILFESDTCPLCERNKREIAAMEENDWQQ